MTESSKDIQGNEEPETFYGLHWPDTFKVETYWMSTSFPNLVLLGYRKSWKNDPYQYSLNEVAPFLRPDNPAPFWLKEYYKEHLVFPATGIMTQTMNLDSAVDFKFDGAWDYERSLYLDVCDIDSNHDILHINESPEELPHVCDKDSYIYFQLRNPTGIDIATTDGIEYESMELFWDAVRKSDKVFLGTSDGWNLDWFAETLYSKCGKCVPKFGDCIYGLDEHVTGDIIEALEEISQADNLSSEGLELADLILHNALTNFDDEYDESAELPQEIEQKRDYSIEEIQENLKKLGIDFDKITSLVDKVIAKHLGALPNMEYWLSVANS